MLGIPGVAFASLLLYLNLADLGKYRGSVESLLTESLGREVRVAAFEPEFGWTSSVVARDVTLANPEWSASPAMISVGELSIQIDLASLFFGPIRIHDVRIRGVQILLESNAEGQANWQFDLPLNEDSAGGSPSGLVLEQLVIEGLTLSYRNAATEQVVVFSKARIEIREASDGMLELVLAGRLNDASIALEGRVGPLGGIMRAERLDAHLAGTIAGSEWSLSTSVEDIGTLAIAEASLEARGGELADLTRALGLPSIGEGSFRLDAGVSPTRDGFAVSVDAGLAEITLAAHGEIDSLLEPKSLDLTIDAAGPDLAAVGRLAGTPPLPQEAFQVQGRVHWEGFPVTFDDLRARVGENTLTMNGVLGAPPAMQETSFRFETQGPDLAVFSALAGVDLPSQSFEVSGGLKYEASGGVALDEVRGRLGDSRFLVSGKLHSVEGLVGTHLRLRVEGPDLGQIGRLAGWTDLPADPFHVESSVRVLAEGYALEATSLRLADVEVEAMGYVGALPLLVGTDVQIDVRGPDVSWVGRLAGLQLPADGFRVAGSVRVTTDGYELGQVQASLGEVSARLEGRVGPLPELHGTALTVEIQGPRLASLGAYAERPLPAIPFAVSGEVAIDAEGYRLHGVAAQIDDNRIEIDGLVVPSEKLAGTRVRLEIMGPSLAAVGRLATESGFEGLPELPEDAFSVAGSFGVDETGYTLQQVDVKLGRGSARLHGRVGLPPEFHGTTLSVDASAAVCWPAA